MSTVLHRCPACGALNYDPRDAACHEAGCGYEAQCPQCGTTTHPKDYDPDNAGHCSPHCYAESEQERHAEGFIEDGGLI